MSTLPTHQTKTELALHVLRERISTGALPPGQRLLLDALKDELGMSPTPIREALRLLQADGLVIYRPHQGIVVAEFSPEETAEIYRLRSALEPLAAELAVPALTPDELRRLERLHAELVAAAERGASLGESNAAWHWAIYEASRSSYLLEFVRRLWERFPWRTMWVLPGRSERTVHEHDEIMAAVVARDAALAAERMRMHVESGRDSLLDRLERERAEG